MSDLFEGQTMTEGFQLISGGAAYTLTLGFDADMLEVYNLTDWTSTAAGIPYAIWLKDQTTAAYSYKQQVIDTSAGASFNFVQGTTNGFTTANTTGGVTEYRTAITLITAADPCVVTAVAHGMATGWEVRITDLGSEMPTARGMGQLNDNRYSITVLTADTFSLQDPITGEDIDSSAYTAYVEGGSVIGISRTQALSSAFEYDPITYKITLGTDIIGGNGDVIFVKAIKLGQVTNLGDIG
jgi:hypothetical protein